MRVLVCRPLAAAKDLADKLLSKGISVSCLPTIHINFLKPLVCVDEFTSVIFTSKYAVEGLFAYNSPGLLKNKKIYSVGSSTAKLLEKYGIYSKYPEKYNSEALFDLIQSTNIYDQKFLIVSGQLGNDFLLTNLSQVSSCKKLEVYRRSFENENNLVQQYLNFFKHADPDLIVTTSLDVFKALNRVFKKIQLPKHATVTITSTKMLEFVKGQGFEDILRLEQLNNDYICQRILELTEASDVATKKHSTRNNK